MPTIAVSKETHARLTDAGRKGETYEDIIIRLLDGRDLALKPINEKARK